MWSIALSRLIRNALSGKKKYLMFGAASVLLLCAEDVTKKRSTFVETFIIIFLPPYFLMTPHAEETY